MNSTNKILQINNLSKSYYTINDEIKVLNNISFDLYEGEFLGLIGPSGCGKSSILNIIANFLEPFAKLMGLDGYILTAFILGIPANEIVFPSSVTTFGDGIFTGASNNLVLHVVQGSKAEQYAKAQGINYVAQAAPINISTATVPSVASSTSIPTSSSIVFAISLLRSLSSTSSTFLPLRRDKSISSSSSSTKSASITLSLMVHLNSVDRCRHWRFRRTSQK